MMLYVIIDYVGEYSTGFKARRVVGYTFNKYYANLFILQYSDYHVDVINGITKDDIDNELLNHYGYIVTGDDDLKLIMVPTIYGKTAITTKELMYTTISELDVYIKSVSDFITGYFILEYISPYLKDERIQLIFRHIFTSYIQTICKWLYEGSGEIEESPIGMIQALIYENYLTPIEELGDVILNERCRY